VIKRYSDHAANERTFLAWVRTAIAIMAFGFLVEKFDLFLALSATDPVHRLPSTHGMIGNVAGLALFVLGGATMVLATVRFRRVARDIDSEDVRPGSGGGMDIALAALLALLGATLFVYLVYTVLARA
jgi:putative membrane protein